MTIKRTAKFLAGFTFALYALLWAWPEVAASYALCFAKLGNMVKPELTNARLELSVPAFAPNSQADHALLLRVRQLSNDAAIDVPIDLRNLTYLPTVCLVALALATPVWRSWRGPLLLSAALIALHVFLVASLAAPLLLFFANPLPLHLLDLPPWIYAALDIFYRALVAPPGMAYAFPALLWVATLWMLDTPRRAISPAANGS